MFQDWVMHEHVTIFQKIIFKLSFIAVCIHALRDKILLCLVCLIVIVMNLFPNAIPTFVLVNQTLKEK